MSFLPKTHKAPYQERIEMHRYIIASDTWARSRIALEQIQQLQMDENGDEQITSYLLRVAFFTLYGRPFKQRKELKIGDEIVPKELLPVHQGIIKLRDKMFAHSDMDHVSVEGNPFNTAVIDFKPRSTAFGMNALALQPNAITAYLGLVNKITETAVYRRNKIWERWQKHLDRPLGSRWVVNLSKDSDDVLLRVTKKPTEYTASGEDITEKL